nr:M23 family metallopeptidase [Micromonospora rosaria]
MPWLASASPGPTRAHATAPAPADPGPVGPAVSGAGAVGVGPVDAGPVGPGLAGSRGAADAVGSGVFRWPLPGPPDLRRRFEPPPQRWLPGHRGVDLAAPAGTPVRSAGAGVVRFAGPVGGRPVVSVDHADGLRTTYEPVSPGVRAGERVQPGDGLGLLLPGHPGCPEHACLHWGLRRDQEYLDPLSLLGLGPVRLLPVPGR